jgi:hypothetical protein
MASSNLAQQSKYALRSRGPIEKKKLQFAAKAVVCFGNNARVEVKVQERKEPTAKKLQAKAAKLHIKQAAPRRSRRVSPRHLEVKPVRQLRQQRRQERQRSKDRLWTSH